MCKRIRHTQPEIEQLAKAHRKEPTEAENLLWNALRSGRLGNLKFRRQHPVGRFILDFYCPQHRLVIEVDGCIHDQQQERDEERTRLLQACGLRVMRVRNEDVLHNLPEILARILNAIIQTAPTGEAETQ